MPYLPGRPCRVVGCPSIGPCARHPKAPPAPAPRWYDDRRGSSTQRGYGYAWQQLRKQYLERYPLCRMCQRARATLVDHRIPKRQGGTDDEYNLQPLCTACHAIKTGMEKRRAGWK
jgi:5-methylcytosine-specific restriction enzyme A